MLETSIKLASGLLLVTAPLAMLRLLGLARPPSGFWPRLTGALLLGLAAATFIEIRLPGSKGLGLYGTIAIQAALAQRERTGRGQHIDMALLDVGTAVLANQALNYLVSGEVPRRLGTAHPNIVPYQSFAVADGHLMLAVGNDGQFRRLCEALGRPGLADEERFASNAARVRARADLVPLLQSLIATWPRDVLLGRLEALGVPAGPINTVADVFRDPQVRHRGLLRELPAADRAGGSVPAVRTPIRFSGAELVLERAAPRLGQHTAEVWRELDDGAAPAES